MNLLNAIAIILFHVGYAAADQTFGAPPTLKNAISLDEAIQKVGASTEVLVEAKVEKVCKEKGCWMELKSPSNSARITFKDYGFFVPFKLIGKTVMVQGVVEKKQMSLSETKHYVKDEGGDPKKITKPRDEFRIVATGVVVKD
jgi:hypothetical protein